MTSTVLAVGATGRLAGLVVPALAARGVRVRGLVRHDKQAEQARRSGASEMFVGDLRDSESMRAAMEGVEGVFYTGPAFVPDEAELGVRMVDLAARAGVREFVFSGVNRPTNGLANHSSKQPVEEALYASPLTFVVLQPGTVFQNIAGDWVRSGVFAEPFGVNVPMSRVDYRDVAEVAAIALTENRLDYGTYELFADGIHTRRDVAALMTELAGRDVEAVESPFSAWAAAAQLPYDDDQLGLLAKVYEYFDAHGSVGNSLVLRAILGREPRKLRDYLAEAVIAAQAVSNART